MRLEGATLRFDFPAISGRLVQHCTPASSFRSTLQSLLHPSPADTAVHCVRKGENLSCIVREHLVKRGRRPADAEIPVAVDLVARANGLKNANLIYPDQRIDLSVLDKQPVPARQGGPLHLALVSTRSKEFSRPSPRTELADIVRRILDEPTKTSTPAESWKQPLRGAAEITSGFGMRKDPFTGQIELHEGIDLATDKGTSIYPVKAGTVTFSGWKPGYGRVVIVQHDNGLESLYAHNNKNVVSAGTKVDESTAIAQVGSTGRSTGPHLHLEVHKNGQAVNPAPYLAAAPVQLAQNATSH